MMWSAAFIEGLSRRAGSIRYILERVAVYNEPGDTWSIASHPGLGAAVRIGGVTVQGATLTPRTWASSVGVFYVTLVGDDLRACQKITRGTIVALKAGFEGMAAADFQRIAIGQVRDLRGAPRQYRLEVLDLYSACRQRLDPGWGLPQLFSGVNASTELFLAYTPGDTTLTVTTTAGFSKEIGSTGTGAIKITPAGGADPFYLTYTGTTATTFTGLSAAGQMGTSEVFSGVGSTVEEVAYLHGHPIDIARRVLASRGAVGNGAYDDYPTDWGLGVLDDLLDHEDMTHYKTTVMGLSSGSYEWEYPQAEPVTNALEWLASLLRPAGLFVTVRQGALTVRAVQNSTGPYHSGITITNADISMVQDYSAWDLAHSPEYHAVSVTGASDSDGTDLVSGSYPDAATLPAGLEALYIVMDDRYFNTGACTEVLARLEESATRVPERMTLICAGLRMAQLAPGDLVTLDTDRVYSRRDGAAGFVDRPAVVYEVSPNWDQASVRLVLVVYPESEEQFA